MTLSLIQPGEGPERDVLLLYFTTARTKDLAAIVGPSVCVIAQNAPSFSKWGADGVATLDETLAWARSNGAGTFQMGHLALGGFSAGCQAVGLHLKAGVEPFATLCADGIHSGLNPSPEGLALWRHQADRARAGDAWALWSYSEIVPPTYRGTKPTIEDIVGHTLPVGDPPAITQEGNLVLWGVAGDNAAAHMVSLNTEMPEMVAMAASGEPGHGDWTAPGGGGAGMFAFGVGLALGFWAMGW